jgi:flagellar protein FlaG
MDITQVSSAVAQFVAHAPNSPVSPVAPQASAPAPAPVPAASDSDSSQVSAAQLSQAVNQINQIVQSINPGVEFTVDGVTGPVVVKVVDVQSQEVIRQFPSQAALSIAQALDNLQGVLLQHKS